MRSRSESSKAMPLLYLLERRRSTLLKTVRTNGAAGARSDSSRNPPCPAPSPSPLVWSIIIAAAARGGDEQLAPAASLQVAAMRIAILHPEAAIITAIARESLSCMNS